MSLRVLLPTDTRANRQPLTFTFLQEPLWEITHLSYVYMSEQILHYKNLRFHYHKPRSLIKAARNWKTTQKFLLSQSQTPFTNHSQNQNVRTWCF